MPDAPGHPVGFTTTVAGQEEVPIFDVTKRLHRADTRMNLMGSDIATSEWFDDSGSMWQAKAAFGALLLELRAQVGDHAAGDVVDQDIRVDNI